MPTVTPYGSWKSPLRAADIVQGMIGLAEVFAEGERIWWLEMRPTEGGRYVVVRREADGSLVDMTPPGFNARTRVHEYGGGSYLPCGDTVYFTNFADQRAYQYTVASEPEKGAVPFSRCREKGTVPFSGGASEKGDSPPFPTAGKGDSPLFRPEPVTPAGDLSHADFVCDRTRRRLIAVQEDHRGAGEAVNTIAAIYPDGGRAPEVLASGRNFYSSPRVSPDGRQLAWLEWDHPYMPWDAAELHVAPIREDGTLGQAVRVAGGPHESAVQPEWSPDGVLYFVSDRTDWWNLYRRRGGVVEALAPMEAEFGGPLWVFRGSTYYAFDGPDRIVCAFAEKGLWRLARLDLASRRLTAVETPYRAIGSVQAAGGKAVFVGGAPDRPTAVVRMDLAGGKTEVLRLASSLAIDPGYVSVPEPVEFPTAGDRTANGFFYAPKNKDFAGPPDERPPLVVMVHGGPTSATAAALRPGIQYYTSRGVAVLDVNYGGSTGYGRKYRDRLLGHWGVVDVDDSCHGARHLASRGLVDGRRMAITGGSAGGYTTLACLAMRDVFAAGASHFGVSDCEALARETHKFESRYLDRLIGPYPARRDLYLARSPLYHVDGLRRPVIFFQGLEDKVVPPNQARKMVEALRAKRIPVAYVEFPGEQHGFRKAENIRRALEGELYFFSRIFGFRLADPVEPVTIENL